jgi:hypothetical protein
MSKRLLGLNWRGFEFHTSMRSEECDHTGLEAAAEKARCGRFEEERPRGLKPKRSLQKLDGPGEARTLQNGGFRWFFAEASDNFSAHVKPFSVGFTRTLNFG